MVIPGSGGVAAGREREDGGGVNLMWEVTLEGLGAKGRRGHVVLPGEGDEAAEGRAGG